MIILSTSCLAQYKADTTINTNKQNIVQDNDPFEEDKSEYFFSLSPGIGCSYGLVGIRYQFRISGKTLGLREDDGEFGIGGFAGLGVFKFDQINKYHKSFSLGVKIFFYRKYTASFEYGRFSLSDLRNRQPIKNEDYYFKSVMFGKEEYRNDIIGFNWSVGIAILGKLPLPAFNMGIILKVPRDLSNYKYKKDN